MRKTCQHYDVPYTHSFCLDCGEPMVHCPLCDPVPLCEDCGRARERAERTTPRGFYLHTSRGTVHILGDPDMDPETLAALTELAEAAIKAIEDGTLGKGDDNA